METEAYLSLTDTNNPLLLSLSAVDVLASLRAQLTAEAAYLREGSGFCRAT